MTEQEILRLYCGLMEEAKTRINVINLTYDSRDRLPAGIVREICYLQFRFICEIISLACLAAHGDIKDKEAKSAYEPYKIMHRLEKLNPHFYPQPVERRREKGSKNIIIEPKLGDHLTKSELKALWNKAGGVLHRGSMRALRLGRKPIPEDYSDIFKWSEKITGLLNSHWISVVENKRGMLVSLVSKETKMPAASIFDFGQNGDSVVALSTLYLADLDLEFFERSEAKPE